MRLLSTLLSLLILSSTAFGTDSPKTMIWIGPSEINALPMTGTAWTNMAEFAANDFNWTDPDHEFYPNLSNTNNNSDVLALAKALVWRRTGGESGSYAHYRCQIRGAIRNGVPVGCCQSGSEDCYPADLLGTECWGGTSQTNCTEAGDKLLPVARNLTCWIIAVGLINLSSFEENQVWRPWLDTITTTQIGNDTDDDTVVFTHVRQPGNHGTVAGAARAARAF